MRVGDQNILVLREGLQKRQRSLKTAGASTGEIASDGTRGTIVASLCFLENLGKRIRPEPAQNQKGPRGGRDMVTVFGQVSILPGTSESCTDTAKAGWPQTEPGCRLTH